MDKIWISFFTLLLVLLRDVTNGQSDIKAQLIVKKYVEKGSNVVLQCKHNVNSETLYKVSFFKIGDKKFYEYIAGRDPPFRIFPLIGAEIDFNTERYLGQEASVTVHTSCEAVEGSVNFTVAPNNCDENVGENDQSSNINQVSLKRLDFDAAGLYYCEVSTDTPIFTKASNEEQLHVILSQTGPPKINLEKRLYYVGEKLIANCTTSKARPSPHITWLIDGKMVDEKYTKPLHLYSSGGKNSHRSKSHQQNNPSYEKSSQNSEIYTKGMISTKENPYELPDHNSNNNMGFEILPPSGYNLDNNFEIEYNKKESLHNQQDFYLENKYFNSRKHRNSKKYRRYVNDGGEKKTPHKLMISSSQLNIEIAKLLPHNGRLEITCLATIPAHVEIGEEFADYKTSSVRIDIETPETTSLVPSRIGASALDGNDGCTINFSMHNYRFIIILLCLPLLLFIFN